MYVKWNTYFVLCLRDVYGNPWANVGLLLGQRRRRWANKKPTLAQRLLFAGKTGGGGGLG